LNIYDVSTNPIVERINRALVKLGTGAFHIGVEVYGSEWSYGYLESGTGVSYDEPAACSKHHFREALDVGTTKLSQEEVVHIIAELSEEWLGCEYDLLQRNCVSFAMALVEKLGAGPIPALVSNLAGAGATLQDGFMQLSASAHSCANVAAAKAGQEDIAKTKVLNMIEAALSLSWYCSGAAELQHLDRQHHLMDRAIKAADKGTSVCKRGVDLVILNARRASCTDSMTVQAKNKDSEIDEMYHHKTVGAKMTL